MRVFRICIIDLLDFTFVYFQVFRKKVIGLVSPTDLDAVMRNVEKVFEYNITIYFYYIPLNSLICQRGSEIGEKRVA